MSDASHRAHRCGEQLWPGRRRHREATMRSSRRSDPEPDITQRERCPRWHEGVLERRGAESGRSPTSTSRRTTAASSASRSRRALMDDVASGRRFLPVEDLDHVGDEIVYVRPEAAADLDPVPDGSGGAVGALDDVAAKAGDAAQAGGREARRRPAARSRAGRRRIGGSERGAPRPARPRRQAFRRRRHGRGRPDHRRQRPADHRGTRRARGRGRSDRGAACRGRCLERCRARPGRSAAPSSRSPTPRAAPGTAS